MLLLYYSGVMMVSWQPVSAKRLSCRPLTLTVLFPCLLSTKLATHSALCSLDLPAPFLTPDQLLSDTTLLTVLSSFELQFASL